MTAPPTIIRCSALSGWPDCPRRGAARLFWREIEAAGYRLRSMPRGIGAAVGTSVHRGAEFALSEKLHSGSLPPESAALDAARDTLQEQLGQGETLYDAVSATRAEAVRQTIQMARLYHQKVAPNITPTLVEHRLEAEVNEDIILSGQPDTVAIEPDQIDDLKTGARNPGNHNAQIGGYSLLGRSAGIDVRQAAIDFIKRVPVGKVQPDPTRIIVPLAIAEQTAANVLRHIVDDLRVFHEGDERLRLRPNEPAAFIANPQSVLCSAKYCPAHGTNFCREWQKNEEK